MNPAATAGSVALFGFWRRQLPTYPQGATGKGRGHGRRNWEGVDCRSQMVATKRMTGTECETRGIWRCGPDLEVWSRKSAILLARLPSDTEYHFRCGCVDLLGALGCWINEWPPKRMNQNDSRSIQDTTVHGEENSSSSIQHYIIIQQIVYFWSLRLRDRYHVDNIRVVQVEMVR